MGFPQSVIAVVAFVVRLVPAMRGGRLLGMGNYDDGMYYAAATGTIHGPDLSRDEVQQHAEADRREVDPPIEVETATWSTAGQLDWWVKERQQWWGRARGADGRQRWTRAVDLRPANGSQPRGLP